MTGILRVSARGEDRATAPSTRGDGTDVERLLLMAVALALGGTALLVGLVGGAAAGHDSPANFTVVPDTPADRQPGIDDATYRWYASGGSTMDAVDMGFLEWEAGGFANCGQTNARKFGIDRGNDDPGTETDETLLDHVESSRSTEKRSIVWYYDEDDPIGEPPRITKDDEVIGVVEDCYTNPSKAGWYQIRNFGNGTGPDGSTVEIDVQSHYFWIGDFNSETEAREELGPPPSEDVETPSPTPEPTPTPTTDTDGDDTETANEDSDGGSTATATYSPTATATAGESTDEAAGDDTATATATSEPDGQNGGDGPTTTAGDGTGFGVVVVLAALAIAMLARGRSR